MKKFDLTTALHISQDEVMSEICMGLGELCYLLKEKDFSKLSATQRKELTRNSVTFAAFAKFYKSRKHCVSCGAICDYLEGGSTCQCFSNERHHKAMVTEKKPE